MSQTLLSTDLLGALERLQLGTRRRLAGQFTGEHRSVRRGSSLDFADYRDYQRGDDPRRIDVGVWARLDQLLVRLYEATDDLTVRLLIDTSASMAGEKLQQAKRLAAALGFVALVRRDVVTVHALPSAGPGAVPRYNGRHAAHQMMAYLEGLEAVGNTPMVAAVGEVLARPGPPGLTVLLSDLLTPEWAEGLRRLPGRGGEVSIVHVLAKSDVDPDLTGDLDLLDAESGETVAVSLAPEQLKAYRVLAKAWVAEVAGRASHAGASYLQVDAETPIEELLLTSWRQQGILR